MIPRSALRSGVTNAHRDQRLTPGADAGLGVRHAAHDLQDAIKVEQARAGTFEVTNWDTASQDKVRDALSVLGSVGGTTARFGRRGDRSRCSSALAARMSRTACRSCPVGTTPCGRTARARRCSTGAGSSPRRSRCGKPLDRGVRAAQQRLHDFLLRVPRRTLRRRTLRAPVIRKARGDECRLVADYRTRSYRDIPRRSPCENHRDTRCHIPVSIRNASRTRDPLSGSGSVARDRTHGCLGHRLALCRTRLCSRSRTAHSGSRIHRCSGSDRGMDTGCPMDNDRGTDSGRLTDSDPGTDTPTDPDAAPPAGDLDRDRRLDPTGRRRAHRGRRRRSPVRLDRARPRVRPRDSSLQAAAVPEADCRTTRGMFRVRAGGRAARPGPVGHTGRRLVPGLRQEP